MESTILREAGGVPKMGDTLFPELYDLFGDAADGAVRRAFDEGQLDRNSLAERVSIRYDEVEEWYYAAWWFAMEYDNDLERDEYVVNEKDVEEPFEGAGFYRSNFVQMILQHLRDVSTGFEWRDGDGDERRHAVVFVVEEE